MCFDSSLNKVADKDQMDMFLRYLDCNTSRASTQYYIIFVVYSLIMQIQRIFWIFCQKAMFSFTRQLVAVHGLINLSFKISEIREKIVHL